MDKVNILGSQISIWDLKETVQKIEELIQTGEKHYICVSNVHTVMMGKEDPSFAQVTNRAALATADGVPLVWASKFLKTEIPIHGRASGPDILDLLLKKSNVRHFFYGSSTQVLEKMIFNIQKKYPTAQIAGMISPPIRALKKNGESFSQEEQKDFEKINQSKADIVWVGLGAPKQEVWMNQARPFLHTPVLIGVGAAFDFFAGTKPRAPLWMQKVGLEWFHRMISEPKRLIPRYLKTNPGFITAVFSRAIKEHLGLQGKARDR